MKILLSWLREFVEFTVEPARLADDLTRIGLAVDAVEGSGDRSVLDLDITTNRVDCMNVFGVAREVAALYGLPLRPPELLVAEGGSPAPGSVSITLEAEDLCPRFCARVLDVRIVPSPSWLSDRLEVVGVRPINNMVDLSNYVMMELGQPSHAFDLSRIPEGKLVVRFAREGERLETLDGVSRTVSPRIGVIAGGDGELLSLAGIMGGASSEVSETTRTVALEAAYWDPLSIRRSSKALSLHTEASHRFERGADPEACPVALSRIGHLLHRIGAGSVRPVLLDEGRPPRRREILFRPSRVRALLGVDVPAGDSVLRALGFEMGKQASEVQTVRVPSWRSDISGEADLVEEIGRHHGLDNIPSTLPPARRPGGLSSAQVRERALRRRLVGAGLDEIQTLTFVSEEASRRFGSGPTVALQNPLSDEEGVLRSSLLPGLVATLEANLRQGRRGAQLFEIGRVFHPEEGGVREELRLGILLAGHARPPHFSEKPRDVDAFDLKGLLEAVSARLNLPLATEQGGAPGFLHPGISARVLWDGVEIGFFGAMHPDLAGAAGLPPTLVAELEMQGALRRAEEPVRFEALDRFPPVSRDLSLVTSLPAAKVFAALRSAGGDLLRGIRVADRYVGPPVPEGKVSLLVSLVFRHPSRTLTSEEVQQAIERISKGLLALGVEIRRE